MEKIELTQEQIETINSFVQKASNLTIVDCIYLMAYLDEEEKENIIAVDTVINKSNYDQMPDKEKLVYTDKKALKKLMNEYEDTKIEFLKDYNSEYSSLLMYNTEITSAKLLISGQILFDRNGSYKTLQKKVRRYLEPYQNTMEIENIDSINKEKSLVKSM